MAEYAPDAILAIHRAVQKVIPDVQNGGVIGDRAHGSGYHRSRNALKARGLNSDYSITAAIDKQGDGDAAAALDLTPKTQASQHLLTRRLLDAALAGDPRLKPLREFGGSLDSKKVTAYSLFRGGYISFDSSHLWHVHLSIHRAYVNDPVALKGIADVLCGVPLAYLPAYLVDPEKVSTTLVANAPAGKADKQRKPLFEISTGVRIEGKWLVTAAGYRYHLDYLVLKSDFEARQEAAKPAPAPAPVPTATVTGTDGVVWAVTRKGDLYALEPVT